MHDSMHHPVPTNLSESIIGVEEHSAKTSAFSVTVAAYVYVYSRINLVKSDMGTHFRGKPSHFSARHLYYGPLICDSLLLLDC